MKKSLRYHCLLGFTTGVRKLGFCCSGILVDKIGACTVFIEKSNGLASNGLAEIISYRRSQSSSFLTFTDSISSTTHKFTTIT